MSLPKDKLQPGGIKSWSAKSKTERKDKKKWKITTYTVTKKDGTTYDIVEEKEEPLPIPPDEAVAKAYDISQTNGDLLQFCVDNYGETVGRGQCWDLAAIGLKEIGAQHANGLEFGIEIDFSDMGPGDIIQYKYAKFRHVNPDGRGWSELQAGSVASDGNHTAIAYHVWNRGNNFICLEQNTGGFLAVTHGTEYNVDELQSGTMKAFRPQPISAPPYAKNLKNKTEKTLQNQKWNKEQQKTYPEESEPADTQKVITEKTYITTTTTTGFPFGPKKTTTTTRKLLNNTAPYEVDPRIESSHTKNSCSYEAGKDTFTRSSMYDERNQKPLRQSASPMKSKPKPQRPPPSFAHRASVSPNSDLAFDCRDTKKNTFSDGSHYNRPSFTSIPPKRSQTPPLIPISIDWSNFVRKSTICSFSIETKGDLDLKIGDQIQVLSDRDKDWWFGRNTRTGLVGRFPAIVFS